MSRTSQNIYRDGRLISGYNYENQAWVINGYYARCGHPDSMNCNCYGRIHAGKKTKPMEE